MRTTVGHENGQVTLEVALDPEDPRWPGGITGLTVGWPAETAEDVARRIATHAAAARLQPNGPTWVHKLLEEF